MSIKQIHELTGFSNSTISRVLNGKAEEFRISKETEAAILEVAKKLNYRPNILARGLRLRKTMKIGLIVPDIQNPFFGELAWRIEKLLREHGYSTILCNTNELPENEEFYLRVLVDRQVDGIIISPISTREWGEMESVRKETEVVLIDRIFYDTDIPWVTSENLEAAENLTSALIEQGYSRIAYLGGTPHTYIDNRRFQGYKNALRNHSIPLVDDIVFFEGYSIRSGESMMCSLLKRDPEIPAVLCVNNLVFLGAMKCVQQHEIKTGQSIMMAAFDIDRYCNIFKRPILCACQDMEKLAESAVFLLKDGINQEPRSEIHITIPIRIDKHRIP